MRVSQFLYTTLKNMFLYAWVQCFKLLGLKGNFLQIFSNFFMSAKRHKGVILANSGEMQSLYIWRNFLGSQVCFTTVFVLYNCVTLVRSIERHLVNFHTLRHAPRLQSQWNLKNFFKKIICMETFQNLSKTKILLMPSY